MHPADLQQHLNGLYAQIRGLQGQLEGLSGDNSGLGQLKNDVEKVIKEQAEAKSLLQTPRFIEDIPGPRMPYTYVIEIPFTALDTVSQTRSVTIAADGPFVTTAMTAFWRPTDAASTFTNQWLPVSRLSTRVFNGQLPALLNADADFIQYPEFSFKMTTGGSGRFWQSDWLAGPMFDQMPAARPWYTGISGWIERTNTVSVEARPEVPIPANQTGSIWMYLEGYQILIPINLAEQFGWTI